MKKPAGYENASTGLWEPLEVGGHFLTILGAKETESKSGRDMLVIQYDTSSKDKQPAYFTSNHTKGKYYQGTSYIVLGEEDWAVQSLKRFLTAVEESNPGFNFDWDNPNCLKGKSVGGVFGLEDYLNDKGEVRTSTKLRWWCKNDSVEGASIPKHKEIKRSSASSVLEPDTTMDLPFDL